MEGVISVIVWNKTALALYLMDKNPQYYGKLGELRSCVEDWLGYVVQVFPHYTNHTVKHSDEIIRQLSKVLFRDEENPSSITLALSATEVYILMASAYLHDIGMVVSPADQREIVSSAKWSQWISSDERARKRWGEISNLRTSTQPGEPPVLHLIADIQMKYLIADHVRRIHHLRSASIMTEHEAVLGRFAFGDHQLLNAIADVCAGHGLDRRQLNDNRRYPTRADIRGEKVCVRLMALLLRIGDLLDMSVDRALPFLVRAATPLPSDSVAHWSQYQRIIRRNTSHDVIGLHAECRTQEEHRFLQDWCEWLVEELRATELAMAHSDRHTKWQPPTARIGEASSTITIEPARGATYKPVKWKLTLDHDAIIEHLIKNIYTSDNVFLRELIQNAADANRCQMILDLMTRGGHIPESPSQVRPDTLNKYPLYVRLEVRQELREVTGEVEERQVLVVDDCGIGMDIDVILNYFLQIGRSFYTSDQFRRQFSFSPTSRFGIGFLSVFGVSQKIVVETLKESSADGPLLLTLNGPKSYILVEQGHRTTPGTRIEVWLNTTMPTGEVTRLMTNWCQRVEFPIFINELGSELVIRPETPSMFATTWNLDSVQVKATAFPVMVSGLEGELYVLSFVDSAGNERWDVSNMTLSSIDRNDPWGSPLLDPSCCLHGISMDFGLDRRSPREDPNPIPRIDIRSTAYAPTLSRTNTRNGEFTWFLEPGIAERLREIVQGHLATNSWAVADERWWYRQNLVPHFPIGTFWDSLPRMIPVYVQGNLEYHSLEFVLDIPVLTMVINNEHYQDILPEYSSLHVLAVSHLEALSYQHKYAVLRHRLVQNVRFTNDQVVIDLIKSDCPTPWPLGHFDQGIAYLWCGNFGILNLDNPLGKWIFDVREAVQSQKYGLSWEHGYDPLFLVQQAAMYPKQHLDQVRSYLSKWQQRTDLPLQLAVPKVDISEHLFRSIRDERPVMRPWSRGNEL